jgi:putative colanic acid biosynthesis acetyltransferase WcaF
MPGAASCFALSAQSVWFPPNLVLGDNVVIGWQVNLYNQGRISIGDYAVVSQFSHLVASTHDIDDPYFQLQLRPVHIGKYAWVASAAFVGPGVTVGEGAVLGARGVAFRDLDPWTVYRGNPAAEIKKRKPYSLP